MQIPPRFTRFVMLADMRTGSNFLEANLNAMAGVTCHGELFNPNFIGKKDRLDYLGITLDARDKAPQTLLDKIRDETEGLAGFRLFHDHDARVIGDVLADPLCAKIVLTRNPLESYVSLKIAQATGQWKLGEAHRRRTAKARFDPEEFEAHLRALQEYQVQIQRALQTSGQTAFWISYEDIGDLEVINGLAAFLGAPPLAALDESVKKQNPEALEDLVENPAEMDEGLRRLDRFNLARSPNFEPKRGPAVPSYIAAKAAPLLYLPTKGGLDATVEGWLAALGGGAGVARGFNQRSLREWQRSATGARSFTLLRHPLLRAHHAFDSRLLSGALPDLRQHLKRAWKLQLPPPEKLHKLSPEAEAEAFLVFLRFLKGNLAGQTAIKIDAAWASQFALLQGFSAQMPADHVLREDEMAEGLAALAARHGLVSPVTTTAQPDCARPLAGILTPDHQAACREAYGRDYLAFGFGDLAL